jgi:hypothetical protein
MHNKPVFLSEDDIKQWSKILDHKQLPPLPKYKRAVTARLLENQKDALKAELNEAAPTNFVGNSGDNSNIQTYTPILMSMVRRAMPNLVAFDLAGVQPMTGPTGYIFAMYSRYGSQGGDEALFNEANTRFSGTGDSAWTQPSDAVQYLGTGGNAATSDDYIGYAESVDPLLGAGLAMSTVAGEGLGGTSDTHFAEMAFSIDKKTVEARTRGLKAEYTTELSQDMKALYGLDAESELANILSTEILAEMNREFVRRLNMTATLGVNQQGTFDLEDADGRWAVERFKAMLFQIELEANAIAKATRRGKGNVILCSSDVASALAMAGVLAAPDALTGQSAFEVDDTGNTFAGTINGRYKVYIDPYYETGATNQYNYVTVGYRGPHPWDAGIYYCPYVPLQMVRAIGENTFQPKIAFKTRYGMAANPFVHDATATDGIGVRNNTYYRIFRVDNLAGTYSNG